MNRVPVLLGLLIAALFLGLIPLSSWPAQAQQQICDPRSKVLAWMESNYGEVPVAFGLAGAQVIEVLAAPGGKTWTIIVTNSAGVSCVVAVGESWQQHNPPKSDPSVLERPA